MRQVHGALTSPHVEIAEHIEGRLGGVLADERNECKAATPSSGVVHRQVHAVEILGAHLRKQAAQVALFDVVRQVADVQRAVGVVAGRRWASLASGRTASGVPAAASAATAVAATLIAAVATATLIAAITTSALTAPEPLTGTGAARRTRREGTNADAATLEQRAVELFSGTLRVVG
jgi:hypothetical protein